jgi:hypothetical protein
MLNFQNTEFKTLDQLRKIAPSIFTKQGADTTSEKYSHIPTDQVIRDMELLGWNVVDAKEVKARKDTTKGFQKHLIVFRNNDVVIEGKDGDTVYPQVLLSNSHDGKNSFSFQAGLFRIICENGLVVATEQFENYKVRHMGYDFQVLQETIKTMVSKLPLTIEAMNKMKNIELEEQQIFNLAKSFLDLRIEGTENTYAESAINSILEPQRTEDMGNGLWEVFNRLQENVIEGNFAYITPKGKTRQARVIKNFRQDIDLNEKMFSKALELVA